MACSCSILGKTLKSFLAPVIVGSATVGAAASKKSRHVIPDFTKGDTLPTGANHDWNLGPTAGGTSASLNQESPISPSH